MSVARNKAIRYLCLVIAGFAFSGLAADILGEKFGSSPAGDRIFELLSGKAEASAKENSSRRVWPHDGSDLPRDPALAYGKLGNGFRYILMENRNPKDRVSMHLNVMAGSMHESEAQRGLAHFLEHMLFNGTAHFPPGELVKYFQRIGMQFGPDANARTGFYETVYDILLPEGEPAMIDEALQVMQDYAAGALLLTDEIEAERSVVLAEKRGRDSADYRTFVATLAFELPDARVIHRLPIGKESVIRGADRPLLKDFYDTWYRPKNMVLVMVGDFNAHAVIPLIKEKFDSITARAPARKAPDFGDINHAGTRAFYHHEAEAGKTTVSIETIEKVAPDNDSMDLQRRLLIEDIADRIVQHRLDVRVRQPGAPMTDADIGSGRFLREAKYAGIEAECRPRDWQQALAVLEQTLRQAVTFGFTTAELNRVKKDLLSELENAVSQAATRESPDLARSIIWHLNAGRVFMSPEQERSLFEPLIRSLTPEAVHAAFVGNWSAGHRLVLVTGNADLKAETSPPEQKILSVFLDSQKRSVDPPTDGEDVMFPYLPEPESAGTIRRQRMHADIGLIQIDFENGIRLNLKPTDYKADQVMASIGFGHGRSSQPADKPGLADLSADVVNESALGGLSREQLARALAGKSTDVVFAVTEDRFLLKGTTVTGEIRLLFQLFYAYLVDPGFREKAYALSMERFRQKYGELSRSTDGGMLLWGRRFLAGGDSRFGLPPSAAFNRLKLADVREWIEPMLTKSTFEVSVVGDFNAQAVIDLAATYFGGMPRPLHPKTAAADRPIRFPRGQVSVHRIPTKIPKALVSVAYPTADLWNIHLSRRLNLLGDIFSDRLRENLRERRGATYSPFAFNRPSRAYRGYGMLQAFVETAPEAADGIGREVKKIAADLAENGVSPEALDRALEPALTRIKDMLRTNGYWLNTVLSGSRRHPEQLDWCRSILSDYAAIKPDALSALAEKFLVEKSAATIVIRPKIP